MFVRKINDPPTASLLILTMKCGEGGKMSYQAEEQKEMALLDLLDRLLDKGIVIHGDLMLSIADIDLIYVGLRLVIGSIDTIRGDRKGNNNGK